MMGNSARRSLAIGTLVMFSLMVMFNGYGYGQSTVTPLARAQDLLSQGKYDEAVKVLDGYIAEIQDKPEQKPDLAAAWYLLAKIYYEVGDDAQCDAALLKVFSAHPAFDRDEPNYGFRERVLKAKAQLAGNTPVAAETTAQPVSPQAKVEPIAAKTDPLPTKTDTKTVEPPRKTEPRIIEQQPKVKPQTIEMPKQGTIAVVKKKKKFPTILFALLGITVVGVVLYFTVLKSNYDIRGGWLFSGGISSTVTFYGSKNSGENDEGGTYRVNGNSVDFTFYETYLFHASMTGKFDSKDSMSGTYSIPYYSDFGSWTAIRISSSTADMKKQKIKGEKLIK